MIRASGAHYFNPDEAAARIRAAQPHLSSTQANSAAWHEGKRLLQHAIAQRLDYNFETTLGGQSFVRLLKQAADAGSVMVLDAGELEAEMRVEAPRAAPACGARQRRGSCG